MADPSAGSDRAASTSGTQAWLDWVPLVEELGVGSIDGAPPLDGISPRR